MVTSFKRRTLLGTIYKMQRLFYLFLCLPFYLVSSAQNAPELASYTATFTHGNVLVNWTIKSGNTCNGARLYHSTDSIHYNLIHEVFGVCGNISEEESYFFLHTQPGLNQSNYYRLELGTDQNFWITRIWVPLDGANVLNVWPSPAHETIYAGWENKTYESYHLRITDFQGKRMYESLTRESFYSTSVQGYRPGLYLISVQKEGAKEMSFQKFLVY